MGKNKIGEVFLNNYYVKARKMRLNFFWSAPIIDQCNLSFDCIPDDFKEWDKKKFCLNLLNWVTIESHKIFSTSFGWNKFMQEAEIKLNFSFSFENSLTFISSRNKASKYFILFWASYWTAKWDSSAVEVSLTCASHSLLNY